MTKKTFTATQKKHYSEMMYSATETLWAFRHPELVKALLPSEWAGISVEPIPDKTRITLRVDADVAKFFRKIGRGTYQYQMNLVLRTFMLARLSEALGTNDELVLVEKDELGEMYAELEATLLQDLANLRRKRVGFIG